MFALLSPTILSPILSKYAAQYGPRWMSVSACITCGALLVSLGELTHGDLTTRVLFVVHVTLIGVCIAIATNSHSIAVSVAAKKAEKLRAWAQSNEQELGWGLDWLTPGIMVSGLSTGWSLGLLLGPASANFIHDGSDETWACLCRFWGGLCVLMGLGSWFTWKAW